MGPDLAEAYFDLGRSALLLGNVSESLAAYAKACQLSETNAPIETALLSLTRLQEAAEIRQRESDFARRTLLVAKAAKLLSLRWKVHTASAEEARDAGLKAAEALGQLRRVTLRGEDPLTGPIIIVSGGCDAKVFPDLGEYRTLLETSFQDYRGTIISGGTTAGISGIVAGLRGSMRKIAHLPKRGSLPADAVPDGRYQIRWMEGEEGLSAIQAIRYWTDILLSGIEPAEVRLLGINGGEIAAFEYRLALALGASVGILRNSGREADRLSVDPDWKTCENLILLPANANSVRAFVRQEMRTR
jgi:hypothetical protein